MSALLDFLRRPSWRTPGDIDLGRGVAAMRQAVWRLEQKMRRLEGWWGGGRVPARPFLQTPDVCLWIETVWPDHPLKWRYLKKIGARRGTLVVRLGYLTATIRW